MPSDFSENSNVKLASRVLGQSPTDECPASSGAEDSIDALRERVEQLEAERMELQKSCIRGRQTEFLLKQLYEQSESQVDERTVELEQVITRLQITAEHCNRVEIQLREQERNLQKLFYVTTDLIQCVSLIDGQIIDVNEAWRQSLGYSDAEASQMSFVDVVHPSSYGTCVNYLSQLRTGDVDSLDSVQLTFITKEREEIAIEGSITYREETIHQPMSILCIFRNTTKRQQAELEFHNTLARAQELKNLKARFISMTSHEFRTPLAVIASSASILDEFGDRLSDYKKQQHLNCIQTYVRHTTQLLDNILLLNQSDAEDFSIDLSRLNSPFYE